MRSMRVLVLTVLIFTTGCAGMTPQQQRALSGGAIGAGGGALFGGITGGSPTVGAVVGGAIGALTGILMGDGGHYRHYRHRR